MIVSKRLAAIKRGDLVAEREQEALDRWASHGIEAVEFRRVGQVTGFALNKAGEVTAMVQWLNGPDTSPESWLASNLMRLSA
jgi:hypothetical protein